MYYSPKRCSTGAVNCGTLQQQNHQPPSCSSSKLRPSPFAAGAAAAAAAAAAANTCLPHTLLARQLLLQMLQQLLHCAPRRYCLTNAQHL
jgi:hypothetical protein